MELSVAMNGKMSSLEIAELVGRKHKSVMRTIKRMEEIWIKTAGRKFAPGSYLDKNNQERPLYLLEKTECLYIMTNYSHEVSAKVVLRWYELEREKQTPSLKQLSPAEQHLHSAQLMVDMERKREEDKQVQNQINQHQNQINVQISSDIKRIVQQVVIKPGYFTLRGYMRKRGIKDINVSPIALGRRASAMCRAEGFEPDEVSCPLYGSVKSYPEYILDKLFSIINNSLSIKTKHYEN